MAGPIARPNVAALAPYPLGVASPRDGERLINLAWNENAVGPSEAVVAACRAAASELNRYPDPSATALRQALARIHGLKAEQILCANGSSEIISLLAQAYAGPGDEVLVPRHGYLYFTTASRIAGATVVPVAMAGLAFSVKAALDAVTPRTRILFLDNPNNPTGGHLTAEALKELRQGLRDDVLLVLDAAYAEYVTDPAYEAGAGLAAAGGNCVMLRTFSKVHGLAGLRVGWAYGPAAVIEQLHRVRQPNNLIGISIAGALAALGEPARAAAICAENARLREAFRRDLAALGIESCPSQGNFVLACFGPKASAVFETLERQGIAVRPMTPYGLPVHLRITIGAASEMAAVTAALARRQLSGG